MVPLSINILELLPRLFLGITFTVSSLGKLTAFKESTNLQAKLQRHLNLDSPKPYFTIVLLTTLELLVVLGLVFGSSVVKVACYAVSLGLFTCFLLAHLLIVTKGVTVACSCFGSSKRQNVSIRTVLFNSVGLLFSLLGLVFTVMHLLVEEYVPTNIIFGESYLDYLIYIGIGLAIVFSLLTKEGEPEKTEGRSPVSEVISGDYILPSFIVINKFNEKHSIYDVLSSTKPSLLLFVLAGCSYCDEALQKASTFDTEYSDKFKVIIIAEGDIEANQRKLKGLNLHNVYFYDSPMDDRQRPSTLLHLDGFPSSLIVGRKRNLMFKRIGFPQEGAFMHSLSVTE